MMYTEITDAQGFKDYLNQHGNLRRVVIQEVDLTALTAGICQYSAGGACFLGCKLSDQATLHIIKTGGVIFPTPADLPYRPYRKNLYSAQELMAGYKKGIENSFFDHTYDSKIYHHYTAFRQSDDSIPIIETLSQRLHDHAIDEALDQVLKQHDNVVAIMGGHAMKRGEAAYYTVAEIAYELTRKGYFVATGGGPGAMEAGNLGAYLAGESLETLHQAIDALKTETDYKTTAYLDVAYQVLEKYPNGKPSLAIPTWFYGHEPTNLFASEVAKYFSNSLREDGLLAIATAGVIYAPGAAGTVQEIFMDATQNHYGTFKLVSPMVFLDTKFWTETLPAYPLIQKLSASKQYKNYITCADSVDEIVGFIARRPAVPYQK